MFCYDIINLKEVLQMLKYDKLIKLLKDNGYTSYKVKKDGIMGQNAYTTLMNGSAKLSADIIDRWCKEFDCQPGDLMEYIPDEE